MTFIEIHIFSTRKICDFMLGDATAFWGCGTPWSVGCKSGRDSILYIIAYATLLKSGGYPPLHHMWPQGKDALIKTNRCLHKQGWLMVKLPIFAVPLWPAWSDGWTCVAPLQQAPPEKLCASQIGFFTPLRLIHILAWHKYLSIWDANDKGELLILGSWMGPEVGIWWGTRGLLVWQRLSGSKWGHHFKFSFHSLWFQ